MSGRRLAVAAALSGSLLFTRSATADEPCSENLARGEYLMRAGLLVEAREAMTNAGEGCVAAREHAADLAWRIPKAFLHVTGRPAGDVTLLVDGNVVDRAHARVAVRLNPGEHVLLARTSDGGERHVAFFLAEGETRPVTIDFGAGTVVPAAPAAPAEKTAEKTERSISPLVWGGFGFAAVSLAVAAGTGIVAMNKTSDLKEQCVEAMCSANVRDDVDAARTYATISTVALVTSAVGAGVGILGLTFGTKTTTKREAASARVNVGPGSIGVAGTF